MNAGFPEMGETREKSHQQLQWQYLSGRQVVLDVPTAVQLAELGWWALGRRNYEGTSANRSRP